MSTPRIRAIAIASDFTALAKPWADSKDGSPPPPGLDHLLFSLRRETDKRDDADSRLLGRMLSDFWHAAASLRNTWADKLIDAELKSASVEDAETRWKAEPNAERDDLMVDLDHLATAIAAWVEGAPVPGGRPREAAETFAIAQGDAVGPAARELAEQVNKGIEGDYGDLAAQSFVYDLERVADGRADLAETASLQQRTALMCA